MTDGSTIVPNCPVQCVLVLASLVMFAVAVHAQESETLDPDVAAIIAAPLSDSDYMDATSCIDRRAFDDVEVIDGGRLLFHGRRGRVWLNQLRASCIGLGPDSQLMFELRGSRYCQLDTFCARRVSLGRVVTSCAQEGVGICHLGKFELISENQAGLIRESSDRYRRAGVRPKDRAAAPDQPAKSADDDGS